MSDDYLWDRTGIPDPDVLFLERMLPRVREQVRRASASEWLPEPLPRQRRKLRLTALAVAAGLLVGVGGWQLRARPTSSDAAPIRSEPPASVPAALPTPSAPEPEPVRPAPPAPEPERLAPPPNVTKSAPPIESAEPPVIETSARSHQEIQAVVARHRNEVKVRCWEPALAKRRDGAAATVKLSVTFSIEPNGSVSSVKAGASPPDYPSLASCVGAEVRGWTFGPAEASITVAVPFVFTEG